MKKATTTTLNEIQAGESFTYDASVKVNGSWVLATRVGLVTEKKVTKTGRVLLVVSKGGETPRSWTNSAVNANKLIQEPGEFID